jgi:hypothetical protein
LTKGPNTYLGEQTTDNLFNNGVGKTGYPNVKV